MNRLFTTISLISMTFLSGYQGKAQLGEPTTYKKFGEDIAPLWINEETQDHLILFQVENTRKTYEAFKENIYQEYVEQYGDPEANQTTEIISDKYIVKTGEYPEEHSAGWYVDQKYLYKTYDFLDPNPTPTKITLLFSPVATVKFKKESYFMEIEHAGGLVEYFLLMGNLQQPILEDYRGKILMEGWRIAPKVTVDADYKFIVILNEDGSIEYFRSTTVGYKTAGYPSSDTHWIEYK